MAIIKQLNAYDIKTKDLYYTNFTIYPMQYVIERRDENGRKIKQWIYLYSCINVFGKTIMLNTDHVRMIKSKECVLINCCRLIPKDENYYIKLNVYYNTKPMEFVVGY